jgi:spore germination cell wall hydrolase CwlJ-like protein
MRKSRNRPRRARAPLGFSIAIFVLTALGAGYQALASFIAQQPGIAESVRQHLIASPFATIHAATFSFPRPIGSNIPDPKSLPGQENLPGQETLPGQKSSPDPKNSPDPKSYRLASLDPQAADITGSIPDRTVLDRWDSVQIPSYPLINRSTKGDRLGMGDVSSKSDQLAHDEPALKSQALAKGDRLVPAHREQLASIPAAPVPQPEQASTEAAQPPLIAPSGVKLETVARTEASQSDWVMPAPTASVNATIQTARLYFGVESDDAHAALEPWAPGEDPILVTRPDSAPAEADGASGSNKVADATPNIPAETIAAKGEVTGAEQRPKSPAERLGLTDKTREKSEKCLTDAIYFEARGESVRGQMAVAQVVMNRVFSGYYPNSVCGVVYQNADRHLACQFTFACDGIPDVVNEPEAWVRAKQIARDTLDGKLWLNEVGKATHYHAYWVRPSWVHEMFKLNKIGVHTFYRPRNWGDGSDAPIWGDAAKTAEEEKKL